MILKTDRLILRPWNENDATDLYEYAKDPDIGPIAGWLPHKNITESISTIKHVLNGETCFAICLKEDNKAIGSIALKLNGYTDMTNKDDECELGYWIGKPFWRKGFMTEAVIEMIRFGFEDLNMSVIWCGYYDGNIKSKGVQEKCGFTYYRTTPNIEVKLLNETRIGHTSILTKEQWISIKNNNQSTKL